jgi:hypothetical protein
MISAARPGAAVAVLRWPDADGPARRGVPVLSHIHVERGDGYAKFWLDPVDLVEAYGLKTVELRCTRLLVIQFKAQGRSGWVWVSSCLALARAGWE